MAGPSRRKLRQRDAPRPRAPPPEPKGIVSGLVARLARWWRRLLGRAAPPAERGPPTGGYRSARGFPLQSRGEVMIADWLDARGYEWEYEARVGGFTPDFLLRQERLIVEYWGMKGHSRRYDSQIVVKKRRYRENGYDVIGLEPRHLPRLDERLGKRLKRPPLTKP